MNRQRGFNLIELLVVVAILGILASIALPAYDGVVMKSRRAEARDELMRMAGMQEKYFTSNNVYTDDPAVLGMPADGKTPHDTYALQVTLTNGGRGYVMTAAPLGKQAEDTTCGTLILDNLGRKDATGAAADPVKDCW